MPPHTDATAMADASDDPPIANNWITILSLYVAGASSLSSLYFVLSYALPRLFRTSKKPLFLTLVAAGLLAITTCSTKIFKYKALLEGGNRAYEDGSLLVSSCVIFVTTSLGAGLVVVAQGLRLGQVVVGTVTSPLAASGCGSGNGKHRRRRVWWRQGMKLLRLSLWTIMSAVVVVTLILTIVQILALAVPTSTDPTTGEPEQSIVDKDTLRLLKALNPLEGFVSVVGILADLTFMGLLYKSRQNLVASFSSSLSSSSAMGAGMGHVSSSACLAPSRASLGSFKYPQAHQPHLPRASWLSSDTRKTTATTASGFSSFFPFPLSSFGKKADIRKPHPNFWSSEFFFIFLLMIYQLALDTQRFVTRDFLTKTDVDPRFMQQVLDITACVRSTSVLWLTAVVNGVVVKWYCRSTNTSNATGRSGLGSATTAGIGVGGIGSPYAGGAAGPRCGSLLAVNHGLATGPPGTAATPAVDLGGGSRPGSSNRGFCGIDAKPSQSPSPPSHGGLQQRQREQHLEFETTAADSYDPNRLHAPQSLAPDHAQDQNQRVLSRSPDAKSIQFAINDGIDADGGIP